MHIDIKKSIPATEEYSRSQQMTSVSSTNVILKALSSSLLGERPISLNELAAFPQHDTITERQSLQNFCC